MNFLYSKDNKFFITEVDEDTENIIFKVLDKIENDYIMIVNDANRYDNYLEAKDKHLFIKLCTFYNMIDFYYNKMIGECHEKIAEVINNDL